MTAQFSLREFFEQELGPSQEEFGRLEVGDGVSTQHLVSHLVERTVHRAALDAATHRPPSDGRLERSTAEVSWKHCLMVAALTELRPVKLFARN